MESVKVLLIARHLDLGGSERQLAETARLLRQNSYTVHIAAFRSGGARWTELHNEGFSLLDLGITSFHKSGILEAGRRYVEYLQRRTVHVIHCFDAPSTVFAVPLARLFTRSYCIACQRSYRSLLPLSFRLALWVADRLAHRIVVNSKAVAAELQRDYWVGASRIAHIRNLIDTVDYVPNRLRTIPRVGTIAVLRPEKGIQTLLAAIRSNVPLLIFGDGPFREYLERLAFHRVTFCGPPSNVPSALRTIDIFIHPSHSEASPNLIAEAMVSGCAVIATDVGDVSQVIEHGISGLLVEPFNPDALTQAIHSLLSDVALRNRLANRAPVRIRFLYDQRTVLEQLTALYSRIRP